MEDYKEIEYMGTKVFVTTNLDIIWNGSKRNIYYNHDGYAVCSIKTSKGWRSISVARLVAIAYIPNPNNLPEVNHKDYDRANYNIDNLEWISRKDNVIYSNCNRPDYAGNKNPNYGNRKLSDKYAKDKQYSIEKQSRKGLSNGRCRKIKIILQDGSLIEFDYILDCCKYIKKYFSNDCSLTGIRSCIDRSIRNNKPYKGLKFIKEDLIKKS